jgi:hypothetical protein
MILKQSEQFFRNITLGMILSVECENISHNPHPVRDASLQDAVCLSYLFFTERCIPTEYGFIYSKY